MVAREFVEFVGDTEEERAVDFVNLHSGRNRQALVRSLTVVVHLHFVADNGDVGILHNAAHKAYYRNHQSHLYRYRQVENDGQQQRGEDDNRTRLREPAYRTDGAPAAHVIRHHDKHARKTRHRDSTHKTAEQQQHEQENGRMHDARNRSTAAVVDIRHRSRNGTRSRNTAEERHDDIGDTLSDKFGVGVVTVADYTVGNHSRQQRLDSTEHRDCKRHRKQRLHGREERSVLDMRRTQRRQARRQFVEVADSLDGIDTGIGFEQPAYERHDDDGEERTRNLLRHARSEHDDKDAHDTDAECPPVDVAYIIKVANPLLDEIRRHLLDAETEQVVHL